MRSYLVGGAVRDALLGLPVNDRDWVVVGATPQDMIAAGYLPVGKDFPVFLHPDTREEYALARTERKTARGYHGFSFYTEPDVTLEQDLARRDLTINAIAQAGDGAVIDPYHGRDDLQRKVLRHVTDAFREDPVRILRVARFAARFADFAVAPETAALMREMVDAGEADALVAERVWQELARGLMEPTPSRMLQVLRDCGALERLLPEVSADAALLAVLDTAAALHAPLPVRFACLVCDAGARDAQALRALCERLRVPTECRELAEVMAREHRHIDDSGSYDAEAVMHLLEKCDAIRKPQRFAQLLLACECEARGRGRLGAQGYAPRERLARALAAAQSVATSSIAARAAAAGVSGPKVGEMIHAARIDAVRAALAA
jgi:tRNA nucleotidyltransferase (CCA-adding enzyme)